jgi:hypothetical protein
MRIRSTKPEFWRSGRVASLSWEDRLLLKGLESFVDDNGVGRDDVALIIGDVFSRDMLANPRETVARVSEGLPRIHQAGLIHRYEHRGTRLLYVSFWESIQRIDKPGKGRMPRPDGTFNYGDSDIRESVASLPVTLAPGTGEQGNRGTGEQGITGYVPESSPVVDARDSTDSGLSPVMKKLAAQAGLAGCVWSIREEIRARCGRDLTPDTTVAVARWLIDKSPDEVHAAEAYVLGAIRKSPLEIQQHIDERGLAA